MRVSLLEIEGFRGIRTGRVQFLDHTVLIGPNNSGKTTIVEALALVLGRDRLVRNITEHRIFRTLAHAREEFRRRSLNGWDFINPKDNRANLSPAFLSSLEAMPPRQRARFYEGVYQAEIDGALWTFESIEASRVDQAPATLRR